MNNIDNKEHEAIPNAKRVRLVSATGADASATSVIAGSLGDGSKSVTIAGTRVQLSSSSVPCRWVEIVANEANTDTIWVGAVTVAAGRGRPLVSLQSVILHVDDLSDIYIDSEVNGEGVSFIYGV